MATNMKTIKFGNGGETYYVNDFPVKVSGTLANKNQFIDFGSFDGLTEAWVSVDTSGLGGEGTYYHTCINGTESAFITYTYIYTGGSYFHFKKVGDVWVVSGNAAGTGDHKETKTVLKGCDSITSFKLKAYDANTGFPAGTKYYLEGR